MKQQAGASSLVLVILADFSGKIAELYGTLQRTLQRITIETCTKNNWNIPVTQTSRSIVDILNMKYD